MRWLGLMVVWPRIVFISSILSLILHLLVGALLLLSFSSAPQPKRQISKDVNIVQAVAVDKKQVELELARIKNFEKEKRAKEQKRLTKLANETKQLQQARKNEEKRLAEVAKKKLQQQQKLKQEQQRVAQAEKKAQTVAHARREEEKKLVEAAAQKRQQEQQRLIALTHETKKLEEKRRIEEERIKQQEQTRKLVEDEAHKKQETEEQRRRQQQLARDLAAEEAAAQAANDQSLKKNDQILIDRITADIQQSIQSNFNLSGLPSGLKCKLLIHVVSSGAVISVEIVTSSGHDVFDNRAITATQKASPLPISVDVAVFERLDLRKINLTFSPN